MWPGGFARPLCPAEEEREREREKPEVVGRAKRLRVIRDPKPGRKKKREGLIPGASIACDGFALRTACSAVKLTYLPASRTKPEPHDGNLPLNP